MQGEGAELGLFQQRMFRPQSVRQETGLPAMYRCRLFLFDCLILNPFRRCRLHHSLVLSIPGHGQLPQVPVERVAPEQGLR